MNLVIIITATIFSLFAIYLFNINKESHQMIVFLLSLVVFCVFQNVFIKMIKENKKLNNNVKKELKTTQTRKTLNISDNNLNKIKETQQIKSNIKNIHEIHETQKIQKILEEKDKERENILTQNEFYKFLRLKKENEDILNNTLILPCFKNKIKKYASLHNPQVNGFNNETMDKIIPPCKYNKKDCTNDLTCII